MMRSVKSTRVLEDGAELAVRAAARPRHAERGFLKRWLDTLPQAGEGCDFDFRQPPSCTRRTPDAWAFCATT